MTSLVTIKKEIQEINQALNLKKIALGFLAQDGLVHMRSNKFDGKDDTYTKEEWIPLMKEQGYTDFMLITMWLPQDGENGE